THRHRDATDGNSPVIFRYLPVEKRRWWNWRWSSHHIACHGKVIVRVEAIARICSGRISSRYYVAVRLQCERSYAVVVAVNLSNDSAAVIEAKALVDAPVLVVMRQGERAATAEANEKSPVGLDHDRVRSRVNVASAAKTRIQSAVA